jgi:ribosomal protein L4
LQLFQKNYESEKSSFVESVDLDNAKTKDAEKILKNFESIAGFETINTDKKTTFLLVMPVISEVVRNSFRNINHVTLIESRNINPVDVMKYRYMIISNPTDTQAFCLTKRGAVKKSA